MDKIELAKMLSLKPRTAKIAPTPMTLSGEAGKRVVVNTAKRVMEIHSEVIKALAKR